MLGSKPFIQSITIKRRNQGFQSKERNQSTNQDHYKKGIARCFHCKKKGHIEKDCWYKNENLNIPCYSIYKKYGNADKECWHNHENQANFHEEKIVDVKEIRKPYL